MLAKAALATNESPLEFLDRAFEVAWPNDSIVAHSTYLHIKLERLQVAQKVQGVTRCDLTKILDELEIEDEDKPGKAIDETTSKLLQSFWTVYFCNSC